MKILTTDNFCEYLHLRFVLQNIVYYAILHFYISGLSPPFTERRPQVSHICLFIAYLVYKYVNNFVLALVCSILYMLLVQIYYVSMPIKVSTLVTDYC